MKRRGSHAGILRRLGGIGLSLASLVGALAAISTLLHWSSRTQHLALTVFGIAALLVIACWAISQYFARRVGEMEQDRDQARGEAEQARGEAEQARGDAASLRDQLEARRHDHEVALKEVADDLARRFADERAEFTAELARYAEQLSKRGAELAKLATYLPTCQQELRITVFVGLNDGDDRVREEVRVRPHPQFTYKTVLPIISVGLGRVTRLKDLDLTAGVENGGGQVHVEASALVEKPDILCVGLHFTPDLTETTKWWIDYRPPGLCNAFRETGVDRIVWGDTIRNYPSETCPLTDVRVRFVFRDPDCDPNVQETGQRGGRGSVVRTFDEGTGQWIIDWHDPSPARGQYEWSIVGTRKSRR